MIKEIMASHEERMQKTLEALKKEFTCSSDLVSRGIDIGARAEIYQLMNDLAAEGKSILLVSSDLDEVLHMSDRVLVMCEGRLTGELDIADATQVKIMELATKQEERDAA